MVRRMQSSGKPYIKKCFPWIGFFGEYLSLIDMATRFAEDPMMDPIPPTQAPRDRAHASGIIGIPKVLLFISEMRMYVTVVVKGSDSRNAEPTPATQSMMKQAVGRRVSNGTSAKISVSTSPSSRIRPISPSDSTKTNKVAKKNKVSHSTASKNCRKLWWLWTTQLHMAPTTVNQAASCLWIGDRNNASMMHPKMTPTYSSSR
mmetsp:Transcript_16387/g.39629  ORF Transcript_16387/g.39629 Transcript_16387/m.39629 type:complete len:203 (-) Transcript_16387:337-945(-)